jgi:hypothetical protein
MQRIILAFFSGSAGGLVVAVVNHFLTSRREKQAHRSDFRGFLGGWLGGNRHASDVFALHAANLGALWGYYGRYYRDFDAEEQKRLKALCEDLSATKNEANADYRNVVARKIEALIDLV